MRLGIILFNKLPYRFRGKYREIPKVTISDLQKLRLEYEREEQNMLLLRHPYLTVEQSKGHMNDFKEEIKARTFEKWLEPALKKFAREVTITERLNHLRHCESWD